MHIPVLVDEVVEGLRLKAGDIVIDGTFGAGGHAKAILQIIGKRGTYLGIDRDGEAIRKAREAFTVNNVILANGSFAALDEVARKENVAQVNAVLLDLGLSSNQLGEEGRGFAFQHDAPLDMRFDMTSGETAVALLARVTVRELATILRSYGDEQSAMPLARAIKARQKAKPITTTSQLSAIVESVKGGVKGRRIHPATKTFQALRIAVNDEYTHIESGLAAALRVLAPAGRVAVISFHSGEDRIVKRFFRRQEKGCVCPPEFPQCACGISPTLKILTKKPIIAAEQEIAFNPRARSAKLRIAEKA